MAPNQHDSFSSYRRPDAPFLQPTSDSFGGLDGREIERSFLAVGRGLNSSLLRLADDLASHAVGVQGFVVAARAYIRAAYYVTYSLGAISIFPFYTMTDRDIRLLDEALDEETGFLRQFARDIHGSRMDTDPLRRVRLYVLALRGIFEQGRVEAMPPGPYDWRLGITEHCPDCLSASLSGPYQRDRTSGLGLTPLPGAPGDGSVCRGLTLCGCKVVLSSGIPLPNSELSDRLRGLLLEVT